jgi:hypothetical protein
MDEVVAHGHAEELIAHRLSEGCERCPGQVSQTSDEEVRELLARAAERAEAPR